jgi:hypothetical protein
MFMRFELHQTVDDAMSITSPIQWAHLYMELEMVLDEFLIEWANKPSQTYDLTVEQFGENGSFKTLSFKEAVCIEFVEMFDDGHGRSGQGAGEPVAELYHLPDDHGGECRN